MGKITNHGLKVLAGVLLVTLLGVANAHASDVKTCKVETGDLGNIIGKGKTMDAAYEDAATKCFEIRSEMYRKKYGHKTDEDTGLLYIDTCVNIRCA